MALTAPHTVPARRTVAGLLAGVVLALAAVVPAHAQRGAALPDFADLVEQVGPAVVNIRTTERPRAGRQAPEMDENLEEFFRRFGIPLPNPREPRRGGPRGGDEEPLQRGVGSGFILTTDGFVMTNAHVVEGAEEVIVTLTDKREFKARTVGSDRRTDVAVVKIDAAGLPAVKIGDINKLRVGEWVLAIGSPFGLENTVTAGIVSAKQRDTGDYLPFIQTDVAVNPGNSGGPLLNMRGEVVGINSQIYSRSGGFMGISFAIPIDEATRVAEQLRTGGRVVRGRIGVEIAPVTKDVAESIGLGKPAGALVRNVETGGPAEKAGIEAGDIITKVDGRAIERSSDLPRLVGATKPGTRTQLQVFRRGGYRDIAVMIGEFEADKPRAAAPQDPSASVAVRSPLGLAVSDLSDSQKRELKLRGGVRVDAAEGAAARAGLRAGDILLSMDNVEVTDARQFATLAAKAEKARAVSVLARRGDSVNYFVVRPVR